jgi:hypothetical protein
LEAFFVRVGHGPEGMLKIAGHRELTAKKRVGRSVVEGRVEHTIALGMLRDRKPAHPDFHLVRYDPHARPHELHSGPLFVLGRWETLHYATGRAARLGWRVWRALTREADNHTPEQASALVSAFNQTLVHADLLEALKVDTFDQVTIEDLSHGSGSADAATGRLVGSNESASQVGATSPKASAALTLTQYKALVSLGAVDRAAHGRRP